MKINVTGERHVGEDLNTLSAEFDAMLAKMQTPAAKQATRAAFDASPEELGAAALAGAQKPEVPVVTDCPECRTPGFQRMAGGWPRPKDCQDCGGSGTHYTNNPRGLDHDCPSCEGSGDAPGHGSRALDDAPKTP